MQSNRHSRGMLSELGLSLQIFKNSNIKFHEHRPVKFEFIPSWETDGLRNRDTDMTNLIVAFREMQMHLKAEKPSQNYWLYKVLWENWAFTVWSWQDIAVTITLRFRVLLKSAGSLVDFVKSICWTQKILGKIPRLSTVDYDIVSLMYV